MIVTQKRKIKQESGYPLKRKRLRSYLYYQNQSKVSKKKNEVFSIMKGKKTKEAFFFSRIVKKILSRLKAKKSNLNTSDLGEFFFLLEAVKEIKRQILRKNTQWKLGKA
eukprot:TRINITY_DN168328_c0_g1_i1.p2 TRINITY_DN168328_c0_g1~~TRINITY_DN168328_c0_g1_i1.p2  ORF type:complete len:109 (+),score=8.06 TRINITY_DN168328_c0_g1_i1:41-367(+)